MLLKKVGTRRNAEKVAEHIEARIKLGKEFMGENKRLVPTLVEQYKTFERASITTNPSKFFPVRKLAQAFSRLEGGDVRLLRDCGLLSP